MKLAAPALVPGICAGLRYVSLMSAPSGHSACASCNVAQEVRRSASMYDHAPTYQPACFITDISIPLHHGNGNRRNAEC